jgi:HK97 family phage prohead protease
MTVETRRLRGVEWRSEGDGRTVTLKPITPGVVDDYGTVWTADVFDASLATRLPTLCWAHDWSEPIGRATAVGKAEDGTPTIDFELDDPEAVPRARQAQAQVASGTIRDCSVGFVRKEWRAPTSDELTRWPNATEVMIAADLDEVSLVLRGAVPGAQVVALRDGRGTVAVDLVAELAKRVHAGDMTEAEAQVALSLTETDEVPDPVAEDPDLEALATLALGRSARR